MSQINVVGVLKGGVAAGLVMNLSEVILNVPIAEWGGAKLRVPIEDDAILTDAGIQFLHPANYRLLVIK